MSYTQPTATVLLVEHCFISLRSRWYWEDTSLTPCKVYLSGQGFSREAKG